MRVLYSGDIFQTQRFGGISRYFVELIKTLRRQTDVRTSVNAPLYVNRILRRDRRAVGHRGVFLPRYVRGLSHVEKVASRVQRRAMVQADVVHHTYFDAWPRRDRTRFVATFHDMINERFTPEAEIVAKKRACFLSIDHCIAVSHATKADIVELYDADPSKITVVHHGVGLVGDTEDSGSTAGDLNRRAAGPTVLWVGERHGYKNFSTLLQGFGRSRCRREGGEVLCVGGPPLDGEELQEAAACGIPTHRLSRIVCDDAGLVAAYRRAAVLAYVSLYEGFGLPPLEAMQCGCPVVASNTSSIPEVVGDAAILVDPRDPDAVGAAIDRVAFDGMASEDLTRRGRARAELFSWEHCAAATAAVYRGLCS